MAQEVLDGVLNPGEVVADRFGSIEVYQVLDLAWLEWEGRLY